MVYIEIIKYLLLIFSSITLGNYIILRKSETKKILLSTIILFLYSLYLYFFLYYILPFIPWIIKDAFVWILISIAFNKNEGVKNSIFAGIVSFFIFFALNYFLRSLF